jgi:hypothetical protein
MATTPRTRRKPRRDRRTRPASTRPRATNASSADISIRWSKVIAAQTRIASHHYDREEVRDQLVSAVLRELRRA